MAELNLGMDKLLASIKRGEEAVRSGEAFYEALDYLGKKCARYAKMNTPVGNTKKLSRSWAYEPRAKAREVTVFNETEYAPYVEHGHQQVVWKDGKEVTVGFVEGKHMLMKALFRIEGQDMRRAQRMVIRAVERRMKWQ